MHIQDHQIKFENNDTNQKNIIISVLLSFLETFLTIAKIKIIVTIKNKNKNIYKAQPLPATWDLPPFGIHG